MSEELNVATPEADVTNTNNEMVDTTTQNEPTTTQSETVLEQPKIKVKYNHEEKEIPYDEAVLHIQKGMNYEKAIERAREESRQTARDSMIAEQNLSWMGKPITTEAEYEQAMKEKKIYENLQTQQLPEEVISEILEGRRDREERQKEKHATEQKNKQDAEYNEFFKYFAEKNKRSFDPVKDNIPEEVWKRVNNGKPLLDAYIHNLVDIYESKIKELESRINIQQSNESNANTSTGSVTGKGNVTNDFITFDTFDANRHDQNWIRKNFERITKSRSKW